MIILPVAFLLEFYIGSIRYKLHPLNIMGKIAFFLEKVFYSVSDDFLSGLLFNLAAIFLIIVVFAVIDIITIKISIFLFYSFSVYILLSFLSTGGLKYEGMKIYRFLKANDIESARKALMSLAGRDSHNLNLSEISRAVIESIAENTGDGMGSVVFYFTIGLIFGLLYKPFQMPFAVALGIAFAVIYKSVNLMDSLVGYRNKKYEKFGSFSARLDDALNYIPFRITAFFMLLSTLIYSSYDIKEALKSWVKFRKNHPSPNGGQLESVIAGALRIKLGGINHYGGVESKRPVMGFENYGAASKENIIDTIHVMELTSVLLVIFYTLLPAIAFFV